VQVAGADVEGVPDTRQRGPGRSGSGVGRTASAAARQRDRQSRRAQQSAEPENRIYRPVKKASGQLPPALAPPPPGKVDRAAARAAAGGEDDETAGSRPRRQRRRRPHDAPAGESPAAAEGPGPTDRAPRTTAKAPDRAVEPAAVTKAGRDTRESATGAPGPGVGAPRAAAKAAGAAADAPAIATEARRPAGGASRGAAKAPAAEVGASRGAAGTPPRAAPGVHRPPQNGASPARIAVRDASAEVPGASKPEAAVEAGRAGRRQSSRRAANARAAERTADSGVGTIV